MISQRAWIERPSSFIETTTQQSSDRSGRSTSSTAIPIFEALGCSLSGPHPVSETATDKSADQRAPRLPILNVASTPTSPGRSSAQRGSGFREAQGSSAQSACEFGSATGAMLRNLAVCLGLDTRSDAPTDTELLRKLLMAGMRAWNQQGANGYVLASPRPARVILSSHRWPNYPPEGAKVSVGSTSAHRVSPQFALKRA